MHELAILSEESLISKRIWECLDDEDKSRAAKIGKQDIDFALERLVWSGILQTDERELAEREFKRFIFLIGMGVRPIAMISPKIDELWHQLVLFTQRYQAFCFDTVGFFVHHTPETPTEPIPVEAASNCFDAYECVYGNVPSIWFDRMGQDLKDFYAQRPLGRKPHVRWSGWTGEESRKFDGLARLRSLSQSVPR